MTRFVFTFVVVLLGTGIVGAQTAPTLTPPPGGQPAQPAAPAQPAQPAQPAEPAPPVEPPPPVEPQPVIEMKPVVVKKDEKPPVTIKYDKGMTFSTADDQFELKIQFRNQMRFQATYPFPDETPV